MQERLSNSPSGPKRFCIATAFYLYNNGVSRFPWYGLRHAFLRLGLRLRIGVGAAVHMHCFFTGIHITVGARSVINRGCYLDGRGGLTIGEDVSVSPECYLLTLTHDVKDPHFAAVAKPLVIGNRAWIGARAILLPGIRIGEGAVIGAGTVVTRDVEPFAIVAGNPARKIGERPRDLTYSLAYFPYYDSDVQP